jgi:hypothetical protein
MCFLKNFISFHVFKSHMLQQFLWFNLNIVMVDVHLSFLNKTSDIHVCCVPGHVGSGARYQTTTITSYHISYILVIYLM